MSDDLLNMNLVAESNKLALLARTLENEDAVYDAINEVRYRLGDEAIFVIMSMIIATWGQYLKQQTAAAQAEDEEERREKELLAAVTRLTSRFTQQAVEDELDDK